MFWPSKEIREFCAAMIATPEEWVQGEYHFFHKQRREIAIWTANGAPYIKIGGNTALTFADKLCIAKAIKKTLAKQIGQYTKDITANHEKKEQR